MAAKRLIRGNRRVIRGNRDVLISMLMTNRIDRREFLRKVGAGGVLMLGGPALLAACGEGTATDGTTGDTGASGGGELYVDNWIEYIDIDENGDYPTISRFEDETGIDVTYTEGVNSNEEWFGKYQAQLAAGQAIGIDLTVLTDHYAARLIRLDYLEKLDKANIPHAQPGCGSAEPRVRPGPRLHPPMANVLYRNRLRHRPNRPRDHVATGPSRPRVRWQGRIARRLRRHPHHLFAHGWKGS